MVGTLTVRPALPSNSPRGGGDKCSDSDSALPKQAPFPTFPASQPVPQPPRPQTLPNCASLLYVLYPISYNGLSTLPLKCLLASNHPITDTAIANPIPIPSYSSRQDPSFAQCGSKRDSIPVRSQKLSGDPAGLRRGPCSRQGGCAVVRAQPGWASWAVAGRAP